MNKEDDDIPTADPTVKMKDGRPVRLVDLPDHLLKKVAHKHLRTLRREVLKLCVIKKELDRREYQGNLETLLSYREYNVFQMMTHATLLGVNNYNRSFGENIPTVSVKEEEEE